MQTYDNGYWLSHFGQEQVIKRVSLMTN